MFRSRPADPCCPQVHEPLSEVTHIGGHWPRGERGSGDCCCGQRGGSLSRLPSQVWRTSRRVSPRDLRRLHLPRRRPARTPLHVELPAEARRRRWGSSLRFVGDHLWLSHTMCTMRRLGHVWGPYSNTMRSMTLFFRLPSNECTDWRVTQAGRPGCSLRACAERAREGQCVAKQRGWREGKQAPIAALRAQACSATAEGSLGWVGSGEREKPPW